jgi:hypothetical protein
MYFLVPNSSVNPKPSTVPPNFVYCISFFTVNRPPYTVHRFLKLFYLYRPPYTVHRFLKLFYLYRLLEKNHETCFNLIDTVKK